MSAALIVALAGIALGFAGGSLAAVFVWVAFVRDTRGTLTRRGRRALVRAISAGVVAFVLGLALIVGGTAVAIVDSLAGH